MKLFSKTTLGSLIMAASVACTGLILPVYGPASAAETAENTQLQALSASNDKSIENSITDGRAEIVTVLAGLGAGDAGTKSVSASSGPASGSGGVASSGTSTTGTDVTSSTGASSGLPSGSYASSGAMSGSSASSSAGEAGPDGSYDETVLGSHSPLTNEGVAWEYQWVKDNIASEFMPYVIEHAEGNPNVIHFLYMWGQKAESPDSFSYTDEEKAADIPLLMQWDYRWGFPTYGGGPAGLTACAPTCMAMIGFGLTRDESLTPRSLYEYSEQMGFWVSGQGTSWSLVTNAFPNHPISCSQLNVSEGDIRWALGEGYPVLINVGIGKFSAVGHFMVLAGIAEDGSFILNDPNNLENSQKTWTWDDLAGELTAAWYYTVY